MFFRDEDVFVAVSAGIRSVADANGGACPVLAVNCHGWRDTTGTIN